MKKGILTLLLCVSFLAEGNAACLRDGYYETGIANYVTIELRCEYINPTIKATEIKRAPMKAPTIGFDGHCTYTDSSADLRWSWLTTVRRFIQP